MGGKEQQNKLILRNKVFILVDIIILVIISVIVDLKMIKFKLIHYFNQNPLNSNAKFSVLKAFRPNGSVPVIDNRNILITAALPYVNNTPHLGNIIGAILSADAYARYCRMRGYNTLFVCGTDQYGTTTEVKAIMEKVTPKQICDKYYALHKQIYDWFQIQFDYFGRTSDPIHSQVTTEIFRQIEKNGFTQTKQMKQFYCQNCKMSLADRYVVGNCKNCGCKAKGDQCDSCSTIFKDPIQELQQPRCSICSSKPIVRNSKHLYFRLSKATQKLSRWLLQEDGMKYWTHNAKAVTKAWLNTGLQDRCITRDLNWGVVVPNDSIEGKKVFYVWFEAPIGYLSITAAFLGSKWREWWMPKQKNVELNQFMGKDNIAFHSILAPATLQCTQQPYVKPSRLAVTEYLLYEGGKFSKSNQIGIFGDDCLKTGIKRDVWRYFLLVSRPQTYDNQFTWQDLATRNKKDLMNTIGNMCHRVLKYTFSNLKNQIPEISKKDYSALQNKLIDQFAQLIKKYCNHMQKVQLKAGSQIVLQMGQVLNKYIQDTQFWSKKSVAQQRNKLVIGILIRMLQYYALILLPFIPQTSGKILNTLSLNSDTILQFPLNTEPHLYFLDNFTNDDRIIQSNKKWKQIKLKKPQIFFEEISQKKVKEMTLQFGSNKK